MIKRVLVGAAFLLSGCSLLAPDAPLEGVDLDDLPPTEDAVVESVTEEAPSVEVAPVVQSGELGTTVATLDATEPGLWLKTPLVSAPQAGRVLFGAKEVNVRLIPIDGPATGASFISLEAMRALDAPLTGFPQLRVFTG